MRAMLHAQTPLVYQPSDHVQSRELASISRVLDSQPEIVRLVHESLVAAGGKPGTGRDAPTADQVLRCLIIKQTHGFTYRDLEFHIADSVSFRAFCRFGLAEVCPSKSSLQRNIKCLPPECLEAINRMLVTCALTEKVDTGYKVRVDCTVTETNIHEPTDSSLLWDCARVLSRLAHEASEMIQVAFDDHTKMAKRRAVAIQNAKSAEQRLVLYKGLIEVTSRVRADALRMVVELVDCATEMELLEQLRARALCEEIEHYAELTKQVIFQTERRVMLGESLPPSDKIVSIFEPHTDIIKKERREVFYGHKLCLTTGASNLVLDVVVEEGNPADSTLAVRMAQRVSAILNRPPRQMAFDGGFSSKQNVEDIKQLGVRDVSFSKSPGIEVEEMVSSRRVYRMLRNFRAGIEAGISWLKRALGLTRCNWRGLQAFKSYVWSAVVTANLLTMARHGTS
jgi:transposase, IS5 family